LAKKSPQWQDATMERWDKENKLFAYYASCVSPDGKVYRCMAEDNLSSTIYVEIQPPYGEAPGHASNPRFRVYIDGKQADAKYRGSDKQQEAFLLSLAEDMSDALSKAQGW
jgi:hypothetical protein